MVTVSSWLQSVYSLFVNWHKKSSEIVPLIDRPQITSLNHDDVTAIHGQKPKRAKLTAHSG